jgi:hypothetical protein
MPSSLSNRWFYASPDTFALYSKSDAHPDTIISMQEHAWLAKAMSQAWYGQQKIGGDHTNRVAPFYFWIFLRA